MPTLWHEALERVASRKREEKRVELGRDLTTAEWDEVMDSLVMTEVAREHDLLMQDAADKIKKALGMRRGDSLEVSK